MSGGVRIVPVTDAERERKVAQGTRLAWMLGAAALMLAVTVQPLRDTDAWWHLALGRFIVAHGIPSQEPFSFLAAEHAWVGQQWLYEVFLAGLFGAGGAALASVVMGVAACAALLLAASALPRASRVSGAWLALAIVLSGLVMAQVVGVRGQVLSLVGVAAVMYTLARWREGRTGFVWVLPPLFLLWANLHASFIVGLGVLALALLLARPSPPAARLERKPLLIACVLSVLATLVNPAGAGLYSYVAETFTNPTLTQVVTEWASPDFHNLWLRVFEGEAVLLVVVWVAGGGPSRLDAVLAIGALAATLQAQRNVSLFALLALPQLALYGSRAWHLRVASRLARRRVMPAHRATVVAAAALVTVVATAVMLAPRLTPTAAAAYESTQYPKGAADYVAQHLAGHRIYAPDAWGGYLAYRFPQGRVVFLYDETAIFGSTALQRYLDIHLLRPSWSQVLEQERLDTAIVGDASQEASALHEIGWTVDCHDRSSASLVISAPARPPVHVLSSLDAALGAAPGC